MLFVCYVGGDEEIVQHRKQEQAIKTNPDQVSNQIIYDEPMESYHKSWQIPSKSVLDLVLKSPRHLWNKYLNDNVERKPPTKAQSLGTLVHTIILENDRFHDEFKCGPVNKNRTHKVFKEMQEEFSNHIIIPHAEYELVKAAYNSAHSEPIGKHLLSLPGKPEVSCYWKDPHFGQALKSRPDKLLELISGFYKRR